MEKKAANKLDFFFKAPGKQEKQPEANGKTIDVDGPAVPDSPRDRSEKSDPVIIEGPDPRYHGPIEKEVLKSKGNQMMEESKSGKESKPESKQLSVKPVEITKKLDYKTFDAKLIEDATYKPKKHAPFEKGQMSPFFFICQCFDLVSEMKGSNSVEMKKRVLINMFKTYQVLAPNELAEFYLFSTGRLDAEYLQEDLGVGNETTYKSCAFATGSSKQNIKTDVDKLGDLGLVIESRKDKTKTVDTFFKKTVCTKRLTFEYVFSEIKKLTKFSGQKDKESILQALLYECTGLEAKYVVRFLQSGNFKMGCAKATIQSSLARCFFEYFRLGGESSETIAETDDIKVWEKALQKCSHQYPNYKMIIKTMQDSKGDLKYLYSNCKLTPGIPCKPMLAKPTKDISIIFTRFEGKPFTCEYKYDGLRGQIHYVDGRILIYSRNLENMTSQYPDVCKNILEAVKPSTKNFIVDSEIVGMDQKAVGL